MWKLAGEKTNFGRRFFVNLYITNITVYEFCVFNEHASVFFRVHFLSILK